MKNDLFDLNEVKIQHMKTRRSMWACAYFLSGLYLNFHHEYAWGISCMLAMVVNIILSEMNNDSKKEEKGE